MTVSGTIVGYDPGGNNAHGLAVVSCKDGEIEEIQVSTHPTTYSILSEIFSLHNVIAIGIDTLTCWSSGPSGWRPADRWLKNKYPSITNSVVSANSLFGSMGLNGMSVLIKLREAFPRLSISETHPKVLYFQLAKKKYNYMDCHEEMDKFLSSLIGQNISTTNDHEWDALISVYAMLCGALSIWTNDLHTIDTEADEELITPCGSTNYWWP